MLFSARETLEDKLTRRALDGPIEIKTLHQRISSSGRISLRAVYKAIHALVQSGVLVKVGKKVFVNEEWARTVRENMFSILPVLAVGERVAYTFVSVGHLDTFWKTVAFQFEEYERDALVFFYNPHNFWAYIPERKESEDAYYAHFAKTKKHAFFTVGGTSRADREFKLSFQNDFLQIDTHPYVSLGRRNHITIMGNIVITARLSMQLSKQIDALYDSQRSAKELLPEILKAYELSRSVRLIVENNPIKSKKLQNLLSSHFYITKN